MWWVNPRPWPPYHHHEAKGKNKAYHQKLGRPTVASSGRKEGLCHPDDNLGVPRPKLPPQCLARPVQKRGHKAAFQKYGQEKFLLITILFTLDSGFGQEMGDIYGAPLYIHYF